MKHRISILILCLLLAGSAVAAEAKVRTLQLEELWRIGGSGDELMFGVISEVLCDEAGLVYLLDRQLAQVTVIDSEGKRVRTLGRAGEGPGEVRRPQGMIFFPDGRLGIAKAHPGSIVSLGLDGTPAGIFHMQSPDNGEEHGFSGLHDLSCRGGNLVLDCSRGMPRSGGQESTLYLASFDAEGNERCRYYETRLSMDFGNCHLSEAEDDRPRDGRWAVGPDGRVYIAAQRNRYLIQVYEPDGTPHHTIERDYRSLERGEDELAVIRKYYEDYAEQLPNGCDFDFESTRQDIETLYVKDDGRLWVRSSRSGHEQPDGTMMTLDEFDTTGRYLGAVQLPGHLDSDRDYFFLPADNLLVAVVDGRAARLAQRGTPLPEGPERQVEAMTVICFRLRD